MKEKSIEKKKLFLPMIISVVITILICLFSKLYVEDFREIINYIFIGLIYVYLYISLYFLFNNFYFGVLKRYFKFFKKIKLVKLSGDINKIKVKDKNKLIILYLFITFSVVSFMLFIWQLILGIGFMHITSIVCFALFIILFILSVVMSKNIDMKKNSKKRAK